MSALPARLGRLGPSAEVMPYVENGDDSSPPAAARATRKNRRAQKRRTTREYFRGFRDAIVHLMVLPQTMSPHRPPPGLEKQDENEERANQKGRAKDCPLETDDEAKLMTEAAENEERASQMSLVQDLPPETDDKAKWTTETDPKNEKRAKQKSRAQDPPLETDNNTKLITEAKEKDERAKHINLVRNLPPETAKGPETDDEAEAEMRTEAPENNTMPRPPGRGAACSQCLWPLEGESCRCNACGEPMHNDCYENHLDEWGLCPEDFDDDSDETLEYDEHEEKVKQKSHSHCDGCGVSSEDIPLALCTYKRCLFGGCPPCLLRHAREAHGHRPRPKKPPPICPGDREEKQKSTEGCGNNVVPPVKGPSRVVPSVTGHMNIEGTDQKEGNSVVPPVKGPSRVVPPVTGHMNMRVLTKKEW